MIRILMIALLICAAAPRLEASDPPGAGFISSLWVFGDSLSDQGNIGALSMGLFPPPPYAPGRLSDGTIWVEALAAQLGLPLAANLGPGGGQNFAFAGSRAAGATTIVVPPFPPVVIPPLAAQIQGALAAAPVFDGEELVIVFSGSNDIRDAADPANGLNPAQQILAMITALDAVEAAVDQLAMAGARRFLMPLAPDIGLTPESQLVLGNSAVASSLSQTFNIGILARALALEARHGIEVLTFDTADLIQRIAADAGSGGAVYGITNSTLPIFPGFAGSTGMPAATSLFADDIHPSSAVHGIFAAEVCELLALDVLPGSQSDLDLEVQINGQRPPASFSGLVGGSDLVEIGVVSPMGGLGGRTMLLFGEDRSGFPLASPLALPSLKLSLAGAQLLGFGMVLAPGGVVISATTPPSLSAAVLRFQALVPDSFAPNQFLHASPARELLLR